MEGRSLGGGASKKSGGRVQKTACDKDGDEGGRGNVKNPPTATKVAKGRRPTLHVPARRAQSVFCFSVPATVFNLLSRVKKVQRKTDLWRLDARVDSTPCEKNCDSQSYLSFFLFQARKSSAAFCFSLYGAFLALFVREANAKIWRRRNMKEADSLIGHEWLGNKIISRVNRKTGLRGGQLWR